MKSTFQTLTIEERVEFFVKCQQLMLRHHPKSSFLIRKDGLEEAIKTFKNNINKYNGFVYSDENVCALWNHILVNDASDLPRIFKENAYQPPNPNYNAVSLDFVVFRSIRDCAAFVNQNKDEKMQFVLFIREGKPKLYTIQELLKSARINDS